jgi:hypothetical protein
MWLVTLTVAAKVDGHHALAPAGEVLELRFEVGVIAAYAMHQQNGRIIARCLLVEQSYPCLGATGQPPDGTPGRVCSRRLSLLPSSGIASGSRALSSWR